MPACNPNWICQPCSRGHHAWCTMEDMCRCPNTWDGEGWKENQDRRSAKKRLLHLTTPRSKGLEFIPESGPLSGGVRVWVCDDCRFKCKWWRGCERFRYCTDCERKHREIERRQLAMAGKITRGRDDGMRVDGKEGAGQGVQPPLPLPVHSGRKMPDSPCDKKDASSA